MTNCSQIDEIDSRPLVSGDTVTLATLIGFLFGFQTSILKLAANPKTTWLGFLFVISAGFAREYDGEDLWREPWHLLLPLAASLMTSSILFVLVVLLAFRRGAKLQSMLRLYWCFLGLYWMTAPLAWFYAIPVERFLTARDAVSANLQLLGLVSIWRVVLIVRVISVLFNAVVESVFPVVFLFADTVALALVKSLPNSSALLAAMGGIRLTESEVTIGMATIFVSLVGQLTYPLWAIGTVLVFCTGSPAWFAPACLSSPSGRIHWTVWLLSCLAIVGWGLVLPFTQPEQQLRAEVEHLLRSGQLNDAVNAMTAHRVNEFPPHWNPLPNTLDHDQNAQVVKIVELLAEQPDTWVRRLFLDKFRRYFGGYRHESNSLIRMTNPERLHVLSVLKRLPELDLILTGDDGYRELELPINHLVHFEDRDAEELGVQPVSDEVRERGLRLLRKFKPPDP